MPTQVQEADRRRSREITTSRLRRHAIAFHGGFRRSRVEGLPPPRCGGFETCKRVTLTSIFKQTNSSVVRDMIVYGVLESSAIFFLSLDSKMGIRSTRASSVSQSIDNFYCECSDAVWFQLYRWKKNRNFGPPCIKNSIARHNFVSRELPCRNVVKTTFSQLILAIGRLTHVHRERSSRAGISLIFRGTKTDFQSVDAAIKLTTRRIPLVRD